MAAQSLHNGLMRATYTSCSESYRSHEAQPTEQKWLPLTPRKSSSKPGDSPFLRLPTEIRLQIYSLLVLPHSPQDLLPSYERVSASTQDYFDYDKKQHGTEWPATADLTRPTLLIRTIDPLNYAQRTPKETSLRCRTSYSVRCDRFRARCMSTTYHCLNNTNLSINVGILRANKQIHAECAGLLYSSYTFDFDTHVEAISPFLNDMTPFSRSCIKSMRFVKRALAYEKEFDRCEWSNALQCLSLPDLGVGLCKLELGVVAGRPGVNGWDRIATYSASDFNVLRDQENMEWMRDLLAIRGLEQLDVSAVVEHCPPATNSMAMASYIRFSASIETALAQYLKEQMIQV